MTIGMNPSDRDRAWVACILAAIGDTQCDVKATDTKLVMAMLYVRDESYRLGRDNALARANDGPAALFEGFMSHVGELSADADDFADTAMRRFYGKKIRIRIEEVV